MPLSRSVTRTAKRYALVIRTFIANLGGLTDHHAHPVIDEKPVPDGSPGWISCPSKAGKLRHQARQNGDIGSVELCANR